MKLSHGNDEISQLIIFQDWCGWPWIWCLVKLWTHVDPVVIISAGYASLIIWWRINGDNSHSSNQQYASHDYFPGVIIRDFFHWSVDCVWLLWWRLLIITYCNVIWFITQSLWIITCLAYYKRLLKSHSEILLITHYSDYNLHYMITIFTTVTFLVDYKKLITLNNGHVIKSIDRSINSRLNSLCSHWLAEGRSQDTTAAFPETTSAQPRCGCPPWSPTFRAHHTGIC